MHRNRHMLQLLKVGRLQLGRRDLNRTRRAALGHGESRLSGGGGPPRLRLDELPRLGGVDDGPGVELAETVLVVVVATRSGHLPIGVFGVDLDGRADAEVLHVAPGEVGTAMERVRRDQLG